MKYKFKHTSEIQLVNFQICGIINDVYPFNNIKKFENKNNY